MNRKIPHPDAATNGSPVGVPEPDWVRAFFTRSNPDAEFEACSAMAQAAARTLQVSSALASAGRAIDLAGLDRWIGRLTASALDLDPAEGRRMRPALAALLRSLDALEQQFIPHSAHQSNRSEKPRADT